ncbi:MAG: substrate-binding domain-containing protein [Lachnospiraceae bacterium]|nr:substrate-binding domain-containing protein [Lachnospiraceae bacterium]
METGDKTDNIKTEGRSRRPGVRPLLAAAVTAGVLVALMLIVSLLYFNDLIRQNRELLGDTGQRVYDRYYVLVTQEGDTDFWQKILAGAKDMADQDNILVELLSDQTDMELTKTEQMDMAIRSKVDGILLDGDESQGLSQLVDQAAAAGIPVVTVYHDTPQAGRISYVSISATKLGRDYGQQICDIAGRREEGEAPLSVCILLNSSDTANFQSIFLTGIRQAVEDQGYGEKVNLETQIINTASMFSAQEEIRGLFAERKPADVFVCLDQLTTTSVSQLVVDYNLVGSVGILGFYESDLIKSALDKQIISATITADTYQMGWDASHAMTEYLDSGYVSDYYTEETFILRPGDASAVKKEENPKDLTDGEK